MSACMPCAVAAGTYIAFGCVIGGAIVSGYFAIDGWWRFITEEDPRRTPPAAEGGAPADISSGQGGAVSSFGERVP